MIPGWQSILSTVSRCYELTGLGYIGVDMVLDQTLGPMLLELNARPGLNIQIANGQGLLPRLQRVQERVEAVGSESPEARLGWVLGKTA